MLLVAACDEQDQAHSALDQSKTAIARGDGVGAEALLHGMLEHNSSVEDVAAYLGEAALLQGDLAKARRWLGPGEFARDTAGLGFLLLGKLELRVGNLPAAGQAFDRALRVTPESPELWVQIGRLRYRGGEHLQAIEAAERATRFGPEDPAALHFRGQLAREAQGHGAALGLFAKALETSPEKVDLLTDLAASLGDAGRAKQSLQYIRRIAEISPEAPQIHYLQAVIAARASRNALARTLLQRAGEGEQGRPAALVLSAVLDLEANNYASAAQTLARVHDRQPDNPKVKHLLARALLHSGAEREVIVRFAEEASGPAASPYLKTAVARAYEVLDDREAAAPLLDGATKASRLTLLPLPSATPPEALRAENGQGGHIARDRIRYYLHRGQTSEAVNHAKNFAEAFPGSADARSLLGDTLLVQGDSENALDAYRSTARVRTSWLLMKRMMAAHLALGNRNRVDALLRDYLLGGSRNAEASVLYSRALAGRGDWQRASLLLDTALEHGAMRDPEVLAFKSEAERQLGNDEVALEFAWRAYRVQPMNPAAVAALMTASDDEVTRERMAAKLRALP